MTEAARMPITLQESLWFSAVALLLGLIAMRFRPELRRSVAVTLFIIVLGPALAIACWLLLSILASALAPLILAWTRMGNGGSWKSMKKASSCGWTSSTMKPG